jgi:hypothetical protein
MTSRSANPRRAKVTRPEMKAAWKEGRKELFYPYGKTYVQTRGE